MPLVPIAVAFAAGLGFAAWYRPHPIALWVAAAALALACWALTALGRENAAGLLIVLIVGGLGLLRSGAEGILSPNHLSRLSLPSPVSLEGVIVEEPTHLAPGRTRLLLEASLIRNGSERKSVEGLVQVTLYGEPPPLTQGQTVAGEFRLHRPVGFRNPGGFDYPAHLAREGIFLTGSGRADRLTPLTPEDPPWPARIKRWALGMIHRHLPPASGALLAGLLLGERTELPRAADDAFRRAGVYHILAVSGYNVALIASSVFLGLSLLRIPRRIVAAVAIGILIGFALVVGGQPSVVRATVMGILLLAGLLLERDVNPMNSLALAALVILLWRPGDLWAPGFQLSFAATLGILYLAPPATRLLEENGWPRWLAVSAAVSLGAQAAVTPVMLAHFNQLSVVGVAANLVVVPLAGIATTLGLTALLLSLMTDWFSHLLFESLWAILLLLRWSVRLFAGLPAAMIHLPAPHWTTSLAFYLIWALLPFFRRHWTVRTATASLAIVVLSVSVWPWVAPSDGRLRVTFLDVGQGDAAFVELPDGTRILIDGGPGGERRFDVGERVIAPFLWNRAVGRLDTVAMSHSDPDHAGGLAAILRRFRVKEFWENGIWAAGSEEILPLLDQSRAVRRRLKRGDRIWLGPALLTVLHPPDPPLQGSPRGPASDENNNSLVLRLDWGLASFLFTGDLEQEGEGELLAGRQPLRHLALKVAHHGSRFSTTEEFLKAGRPRLAVISVGARNPFRHPTPGVIERLEQAGVRTVRTDRDGAIIFETDGRTLTVTRWASRQTERFDLEPERGEAGS
jgi:competence protein ComEC